MIQGENVFWTKTKVFQRKTISCVFKTDKSEDAVFFIKMSRQSEWKNTPLYFAGEI